MKGILSIEPARQKTNTSSSPVHYVMDVVILDAKDSVHYAPTVKNKASLRLYLQYVRLMMHEGMMLFCSLLKVVSGTAPLQAH